MAKAVLVIAVAIIGLVLIGLLNGGSTINETPEARAARKMDCSKAVYRVVSSRMGSDSPTAVALAINKMTTSEMNSIMDGISDCRGFGV